MKSEAIIENNRRRIRGLDSIRFICAMWVVFSHLGFLPLFSGLAKSGIGAILIRGLWGNLFAGPPAVTVFFVISGFCIHYPFRHDNEPPLGRYLLRRYVRIGLPAVGGMLLIHYFAPGNDAFNVYATSNTVVWSLLAEAVYYTIYPLLFLLNRRYGWGRVIAGSTLAALLLMLIKPGALYLPSFGPYLTWIVGLPSWLWGCKLAEMADRDANREVSAQVLWGWRVAAWAGSSLASVLRFHSPIGYPWTLMVFTILVAGWLREEIAYHRAQAPNSLLEWAGKWSYSIYILHLVIPDIIGRLAMPDLGKTLAWTVMVMIVLFVCYLFYLVVELPSHRLARSIGR